MKTPKILLTLNQELYTEIEKRANKKALSLSSTCRSMLKEYIETMQTGERTRNTGSDDLYD